ncbi:Lrp/AsnC family transcriptional regulator [Candidatus Woesearchaeota archaeon]|jgi:DNA-binding Lrp family transcriptional regulator|nr:Lrp/AsnC family transcriptional regulator [Candidatus Woesearchaeota archaeon]
MPKNNKLNVNEKKILALLDQNARMPFSLIGKRLKKSQQQVSFIVDRLKKRDIIKSFYTIIDYSKLDILNFRVYFKVSYVNEKKLDEFIKYLISDPYSSWVSSCGGRYDVICTFFASNVSQFNKHLRSIIEQFPEQINTFSVLTTIILRNFGRKYLSVKPANNELFVGGDRIPEILDEIDLVILKNLSEDARKSSVEISNSLNVTPKTIINRIKSLENKQIILGYKPLINLQSINYTPVLILIKFHNISSVLENELVNYLKFNSNVFSLVKTIGEWDMEITIETQDQKQVRKIELEIRQKFALLIQQIELIPLYQPHKMRFMPGIV